MRRLLTKAGYSDTRERDATQPCGHCTTPLITHDSPPNARRSPILPALLALLLVGAAVLPDEGSIESISVADLRAGLTFLASDEMQGRAVGTESNERAARYLANRFARMGLEPGGTQGFFQPFKLTLSALSGVNQVRFYRPGRTREGKITQDFFPSTLSAAGVAEGELVFAGFGITAPEYDYDDYRGLEVAGKIAVVLDHEPGEYDPRSRFDGIVESDYARDAHKILNAQKRGVVGLIVLRDIANHGAGSFKRQARNTWPEEIGEQRPQLQMIVQQSRIPMVFVSPDFSSWLFTDKLDTLRRLQQQLEDGRSPAELDNGWADKRARLQVSVERQYLEVSNVLGLLPGSDPRLKSELVVIGAHFDHIGGHGDRVFNGADDNASGTVGLLEIAEAYSASRSRPLRSVLFVGWNAEERGLLGSYFYVNQPRFPLEETVAMFQMDMIGRDEEVPEKKGYRFRGLTTQSSAQNRNAVNVLGYSRSSELRELVERANGWVGLDMRFRYDNHELSLLRRSDNWPFLTRRIPALFFHTGLHPDYHRPSDTIEKINFKKLEKIVRLVFLTSWQVADSEVRPRFHPLQEIE